MATLNGGAWVCPVCSREYATMRSLRGHLTRETRKEWRAHRATPDAGVALFTTPRLIPARVEHFQPRAVSA